MLRANVCKNSKTCYLLYSVCLGHKTLCIRLTARGLQESRQHVTFNPCIWRGSLNGLSLALSNRIVFPEFLEAKVIVWNLIEDSDLFRVSPLTCDSK